MIDQEILITCPVAGDPVSTGFRAPIGTDITALKGVKMPRCPACRGAHIWSGTDGYWKDEPPSPTLWQELREIWCKPKRN